MNKLFIAALLALIGAGATALGSTMTNPTPSPNTAAIMTTGVDPDGVPSIIKVDSKGYAICSKENLN